MTFEDSSVNRILKTFSRRDLFRAVGLAAGGAMLLGLPKFLGGWTGEAHAAIREGMGLSRIALELDGKFICFLQSIAGGNLYADMVQSPVGMGGTRQKHVGQVKFESIEIEALLRDELQPLMAWINDTPTKNPPPRNGAILYADMNGNEVKRLEFFGAVINEFAMSAADARSGKDLVSITVRLTPETTRLSGGKGKLAAFGSVAKSKSSTTGAFRFNIQGLEKACARIHKVQGIGYKGKAVAEQFGDTRRKESLASLPEYTILNVHVPELDAGPFYQWIEDSLIKGKQAGSERGGLLEWLDPTLKTVLASVQLGGLGIVRYAPNPVKAGVAETVPIVQVDMYYETMTVKL